MESSCADRQLILDLTVLGAALALHLHLDVVADLELTEHLTERRHVIDLAVVDHGEDITALDACIERRRTLIALLDVEAGRKSCTGHLGRHLLRMEAEVRVRDAIRQLLDLCEEIRRDGDAMIAIHRFPEAAQPISSPFVFSTKAPLSGLA